MEDLLEAEMKIRRKMMMRAPAKIKRVIISIALVIKTMMNSEEEEEEGLNKGPREEVLEEPVSNVGKKGIEPLNTHNIKEGQIEAMKIMHMWHM